MPNNPVQIILNDRDFHRAPEPGQPPRNKDFFEAADEAFKRHKQALIAAAEVAADEIRHSPHGPAAYLKVQMRTEALAKSYRPVGYLFIADQFPCVGADAIGTLYFRASLIFMDALILRMNRAETEVAIKYRQSDGEPYRASTAARAEVGAIESIEIAPAVEKRQFSTAEAMGLFDDPRTVSGYQIELFETPARREISDDPTGCSALTRSLEGLLKEFGKGSRAFLSTNIGRTPVLELQLTLNEAPAIVDDRLGSTSVDGRLRIEPSEVDRNSERHETSLSALQAHPLVRAIGPPVQLQLTDDPGCAATTPAEGLEAPVAIPERQRGSIYPRVGIIDSGIASVLGGWVLDRFDYLDPDDCDPTHGTAVAGMVTIGQGINSPVVAPEPDGCVLYDAALYPKGAFMKEYPRGFSDFLEELEQAVREAVSQHGIRIFNLSVNATLDVAQSRYSIYAARLDQIADTYGVLFVNSVGNLPPAQSRAPWQKRPVDVKTYLAARTSPDTIRTPAESTRAISVGALNPPGTNQIAGAPTVYTRRGPGLQVGVKPDVATVGGAGQSSPALPTGLMSITPDGATKSVVGTSYAAPLVARTTAELDVSTASGLTIESLKAMLVHHTRLPAPLAKRGLKDIARQFVGYGLPDSAMSMLETDDHQITLLFQSRLTIGERKPAILLFPFSWPQSLVVQGRCSGCVRITLAYSPPLDPAFGAEFVRVNLEARLKQRLLEMTKDGKVKYANRIKPKYLPNSAGLAVPEKALISHGLKWWPIKQYEVMLDEAGETSDWHLEVSSLVRAESTFPAEGVPFSLVMTIEDPDGRLPVFRQFQQQLHTSRANAQALRTVFRVRSPSS